MRACKNVVPLGVAFLILLYGCSSDDPVGPPINPDVNTYLKSLPTWAAYSPPVDDEETFDPRTFEIDVDGGYVCAVTNASLTRNPEAIVTFSPDSEILWLGSLIQGKDHRAGLGSLRELSVRQREPLTVYIDLLFSANTEVVQSPDLASVGQAIGKLVDVAQRAGHLAGSSIFYNQVSSHSLDQSALKLGLSANYLGATVRTSLEAERTSASSTLAATFIQKMFTTSMVLPQAPVDVFSPAFTSDILADQVNRGNIGPDNLPVYVSSITWGRMLTLTMTSDSSLSKMKAALDASSTFIDVDISSEHAQVLQNSELKVVTIGGHAQAAIDLIRTGRLGEFFKDDAPLTTARPISYTLRNLGDNSIAKVSETTSYAIRECQAGVIQQFSNLAEWNRAVSDAGLTPHILETTPANVALAEEVLTEPGLNTPLGNDARITFLGTNTGFPFDFYLENTKAIELTTNRMWGLVYRDNELGSGVADRWISIGDVDGVNVSVGGSDRAHLENDDFDLQVSVGDLVYAIGITIGDNGAVASESIRLRGDAIDQVFDTNMPTYSTPFVGFLSAVPITTLSFDEDAGGDDIVVRDFRFAVRQ